MIDPTIIVSLINGIALIIVAIIVNRVHKDVRKIETATNSMKDALVASTARASLAEGTAIGRAEIIRENKEMG